MAIVDLETTGLPSNSTAEILEFGVLTFDLADPDRDLCTAALGESTAESTAKVEVRALAGLIRPRFPLPSEIKRLTGLRDRDVEAAKRLDEVRYRVAAALEGRVLIAHNAEFERNFLTRYVSKEFKHAVFLDTQDLFALTHPDSPDLRLASFIRLLLDREERHRALSDALDTGRVLAAIAQGAERAEDRYLVASRALTRYAPSSPWLQLLRSPLIPEPDRVPDQFIYIADSNSDSNPQSNYEPVPFDEDAIADVLADEERGRAYFPGYRVRREQIELARHFVRNFKSGGTLLLEGGTGVGKSLAYLAAAIPFAIERRRSGQRGPIVISTRTKLLQDQLLRKDIAAAARFLGYPELRALSIKGRANYVCERRLTEVLEEGREIGSFAEERYAYAVLLACARTRPYAEIGDLPSALLQRYPGLRDLRSRSVARRAEHCSREECGKTKGCPFGARRAALSRADLVVANHDLLLRWPSDYPKFTHVIADEAHEVPGVADDVYAQLVHPDEVLERIDEIFGRPSNRGEEPLLPLRLRKQVAVDVVAWRREIDLDFTNLGKSVTAGASEYGELQLPLDPDRVYPEAAEFARLAALHIDAVVLQAERLAAQREDIDHRIGARDPADDHQTEDGDRLDVGDDPVKRAIDELRDAADGLRTAFAGSPNYVSSFESLGRSQQRFRLLIRPVSLADSYHASFMDLLDSFAAVSASLFVAGDAFASLGELEIDERGGEKIRRVAVDSPFPYADNMRVVALKPVEDATSETAAVIAILAEELGGRTLGLFTSLARMNEVAALLDTALEGTGIEILTPRYGLEDPAALVQRFANSRGGAVLLGARTFWQGLDLPGDVLQAVVIEKLPFEVPTELRKRRENRLREAGVDPFSRMSLGKMLLHLKQMAGRLIRSETDVGITVIVDARTDRAYFRRLKDAFPKDTKIRAIRRHQLPSVLAEIELGRGSSP